MIDINGKKYMKIDVDGMKSAANELSHGGFKLYLYLSEGEDGEESWLNPKDFMQAYHCSKSTYDRAKAELIEKGYIYQEDKIIHFYANKENNSHELLKELKELF